MGWRAGLLVLVAAGCHHTPVVVAPRPAAPTAPAAAAELPPTEPVVPVLDAKGLATPPAPSPAGPQGKTFRRLTERDCLLLAAGNTGPANLLDEENRVPVAGCPTAGDELRRTLRFYAALEARNGSAAAALERYFQLTDAEARTDLSRRAFPIGEELLAKARAAKAAEVRFPLDPAELERQRSQLLTQIEQAEHGSRLLNLDLKRRLGLPAVPPGDRLWPTGDFALPESDVGAEASVETALADRPELRGLRALYHGLTPETLPDARSVLRAGSPLLGVAPAAVPVRGLARLSRKPPPDPTVPAELEVRRKQLFDLIAERERQVADETRAAAFGMQSQRVRVGLARDRVTAWEEKLADAVKKKDAKQPGADLLEPQARADLLKARAELAGEVSAWHQARVKLRAATGQLVWETVPGK